MTQGNIKPIQAAEHPIDPGVRIGYPTRPELAPIFGELDLDDLLAEDA